MSLGEAVRHPVDKFVIASALILFFAGAQVGLHRLLAEDVFVVVMIAGILFIAAAVGKFVTGLDTLQKRVVEFHAGSGMTPMGGKGLISTQMGFV